MEATTGVDAMSLQDFVAIGGIMVVIVGALWASQNHRLVRIEKALNGLIRNAVTKDACKELRKDHGERIKNLEKTDASD